ncbi:MAG: SUMF1/EgtB/PvdO family nonheme iron enzyme [Candidatus Thiodiazotropha sp.]
MGYDPNAENNESPVHVVKLDKYEIARYPVTVSEYAEFLDHGDSIETKFWKAGGLQYGPEPANWKNQTAFLTLPPNQLLSVNTP